MRATHWLIGCAVCIAGLGSATAASLDVQGLNTSAHSLTMDSVGSREAHAGSGGDALGLSHDAPSSSSSSSSGDKHGHSAHHPSAARKPVHRLHLGWQSLLPGSIQ